jgi:purine-binding chemotaxis protein CheW
MTDPANTSGKPAQELIAFRIGQQEFCVEVMSVREIRGWTPVTPVPQAPSYVRGIVNLRGTLLPIVDLAARLGYPSAEPTARHVIMVAQVGRQNIGLLVDGVSDIFTIQEGDVQPTPDVASEMARTFVRGVILMDKRMISLVAIENIVPPAALKVAA